MREVFPEFPADEVRECPAAGVMPKIFRVLACGSIEDLRSLVDLDVLSADMFVSATGVTPQFATDCWREALTYKAPKSVRQAIGRPDGEGEQWMEAIMSEIDFFFQNGHIMVCHKDDKLDKSEIPPMSWLKNELPSLSRIEYITDLALNKLENGGTIDECIDVLKWLWVFERKMQALTRKDGVPTADRVDDFQEISSASIHQGMQPSAHAVFRFIGDQCSGVSRRDQAPREYYHREFSSFYI
jgi:hypothetical protein